MLKLVIVGAGSGREDHAVDDVDDDTKPVVTRNCAEKQEELVLRVWRIKCGCSCRVEEGQNGRKGQDEVEESAWSSFGVKGRKSRFRLTFCQNLSEGAIQQIDR